jgi:hypothetical protein
MSAGENKTKEWYQIVEEITPYMVRVVTRNGHGTGVLLANSSTGQFSGIATAYHVIAEAYEWGLPIRLEHQASQKFLTLNSDRYIEANPQADTAVILFDRGDLPLPRNELSLVPEGKFQKVGCEVGWLGFPAMSPNDLCFFSGSISNRNANMHSYFVDGVAINGVSGGPVFSRRKDGTNPLVGIISAYIPNLSTGTPMPGLAIVRDVSPFFATIKKLKELPSKEEQQQQQGKTAGQAII